MKPMALLIFFALLAGCTAAPAVGNLVVTPASTSAVPTASTGKPGLNLSAGDYAPIALTRMGLTRIQLIDLSTGQPAADFEPLDLPAGAEINASAASADGQRLALVSGAGTACQPYAGGSACQQAADTLHLVDMAAWKMLDIPLPGRGHVSALAFDPDGSRLALAYNTEGGSVLLVYETSSGEQAARLDIGFPPEWLAYVLDGKTLAVYGVPPGAEPGITQPGSPRLLLLAPASLEVAHELRFDSLLSGDWCLENCSAEHEERSTVYWKPALALSPGGNRLYIMHADRENLSIVDLARGAVHEAPVEVATSWLERLLSLTSSIAYAKGPLQGAMLAATVSSDGSALYVLTNRFNIEPESVEEAQMLQAIELPSGMLLASRELPQPRYMHALEVDPGTGQLLVLGYNGKKPLLEAVSAQTLETITSLTGWEITPGAGVLLGRRVVSGGSELAVIDPSSLEVLRTWQVDGEATWVFCLPQQTAGF